MDNNELLTIRETMDYLKISRATFYRLRKTDPDFPQPSRFSRQNVKFQKKVLDEYCNKKAK